MKKVFERTMQGATVGRLLSEAAGTILTAGATLAFAPVAGPAMLVAAGAAAVAGGSTAGAAETINDNRRKKAGKNGE